MLSGLVGVLPVIVVGGLAMKMTDSMFNQRGSSCPTPGRKIRSKGMGRGLARGGGRGPIGRPHRAGSGLGFGNFSNLRL